MSQSLASILVHVIFSTKNRTGFIRPEVEKEPQATDFAQMPKHARGQQSRYEMCVAAPGRKQRSVSMRLAARTTSFGAGCAPNEAAMEAR